MKPVLKPRSHDVIQRMIPPLAVWAVGKVLEVPKVRRALYKIDDKFYREQRSVKRHVANNRAWLAAGAAAIVLGISLMARATKR